MESTKEKNISLFWYLNITGWLLITLLEMVIFYRSSFQDFNKFLQIFFTYGSALVLTVPLRFFYRKINIISCSLTTLLIYTLVYSILFTNIWYWIDVLITITIVPAKELLASLTLSRYVGLIFWRAMIIVIWSILYFGIKFWQEWNIQKERTEKANLLAQSAQLQMLRYQLNPHFLFNALNSIRALVEENKQHAKVMITELSEFLRYSLISKNFSDVPFNEEINAIRHYFAIEKIRYEDKLNVSFDIDPLSEDYPVLSFLLHPLVENAIKYGMKTSSLPLKIGIQSRVENDVLKVEVCNSGHWVDPNPGKNSLLSGTGTGLNNVQKRLENAYPNNHHFEVIKEKERVIIRFEIHKLPE